MRFLTNEKLVLVLFIFTSSLLSATTIVPFPNLGEMAKASESAVLVQVMENFEYFDGKATRFRTSVRVLKTVKGVLLPGDRFVIQNLHLKTGELERTIWGDLELKTGKNYFLFLDYNANGYWQPKMLSYAAFEEMSRDGENVLVPFGLGAEVQILSHKDGIEREPLKVFKSEAFMEMLQGVVSGEISWDIKAVQTNYPIQSFMTSVVQRDGVNPGHCTHTVSGTPPGRWQDLETTDLPVYYHTAGDPGCVDAETKIQGAITDMNTQYTGINLSDGGAHTFVPSCSGGQGATDNEFTTWVNNNLNQRSVLIQFDDPCSEIPDLSSCNGTLAIGGLYVSTLLHNWCGVNWQTAAYGYVVVNNGTGTCQCDGSTDYDIMITHEMTHSLNVGHIDPGTGTANMNPSCCNTIQNLDIQCLDYMYLTPALPVELTRFDGKLVSKAVELDWQTSSELDNDQFIIERSSDGIIFEKLGTLASKGDSYQDQFYKFMDWQPLLGTNYYRLSQIDLDGTRSFIGEIITVDYSAKEEISIYPNPLEGDQLQLIYQTQESGTVSVEIFNIAGQVITVREFQANAARNIYDIELNNLNSGIYIVKTSQGAKTQSLRFVKT